MDSESKHAALNYYQDDTGSWVRLVRILSVVSGGWGLVGIGLSLIQMPSTLNTYRGVVASATSLNGLAVLVLSIHLFGLRNDARVGMMICAIISLMMLLFIYSRHLFDSNDPNPAWDWGDIAISGLYALESAVYPIVLLLILTLPKVRMVCRGDRVTP